MFRSIDHPQQFREQIREKLEERIPDQRHCINLEKGVFNYSLKEAEQRHVVKKWDNKFFVQIYTTHLVSVMNNLTDHMIQDIFDGTLKPQKIAFMTHQELNPERWQTLIDAKSKRDKMKFEVNMAASTDIFTCRKCRGNQCTYYQMQTRSADEPMTTYLTCILCGHRWKQN